MVLAAKMRAGMSIAAGSGSVVEVADRLLPAAAIAPAPGPTALDALLPTAPAERVDGAVGYGLIRDLPTDERPRERFKKYGAGSLSNAELLAIIWRTGSSGKDR